ncbi:MAG: thioredoxin [Malacoplasma sp.]|nr:thioredoxin [Malacoplasma sp.]
MSNLKKGNDKNLDLLIGQTKLTLVKFGATWCGPCKMIAPILEELADQYADINFVDVDIDDTEAEKITAKFNIQSVPTVILFKDGKQVNQFMGFRPKEEISKLLESL